MENTMPTLQQPARKTHYSGVGGELFTGDERHLWFTNGPAALTTSSTTPTSHTSEDNWLWMQQFRLYPVGMSEVPSTPSVE